MSDRLREEFNQWVLDGRSARLESQHRSSVEDVLRQMQVQRRDRVLEVGCGEGWTSRLLAEITTEGLVVGLDVSEEMIRVAR
ncbi:MAG: methyltransferase domain-containing protein [Acidobacteria bacterium]|nr:methyltransferase domain-containing protein [Acidobacteriota bacterium]